jgi:hypothetical protein
MIALFMLLPALTGPWIKPQLTAAPSPLYRISVTRRIAAITREPKTFNNCLGFEQGLWQRQNM